MPTDLKLPTNSTHISPTPKQQTVLKTAGAGFALWIVVTVVLFRIAGPADLTWATSLFLLAPLVLVRLGLPSIMTPARTALHPRLWAFLCVMITPATLLLAVAVLLPVGALSGILSIPWLIITGLIALLGLLDCRSLRNRQLEDLYENAAMMFLCVGGAWAVLSRWGVTVLGFSDIIVVATAVHFHYAGFLFPLLNSKMLRNLRGRGIRIVAAIALAGIAALAAGITLSRFGYHYPELIAALSLSVAAIILALAQFRLASYTFQGRQRFLLSVSALSLIVSMTLAILFAAGVYRGVYIWGIDIPWMLRSHAVINVFGYALCGLLAWNLAPQAPSH